MLASGLLLKLASRLESYTAELLGAAILETVTVALFPEGSIFDGTVLVLLEPRVLLSATSTLDLVEALLSWSTAQSTDASATERAVF